MAAEDPQPNSQDPIEGSDIGWEVSNDEGIVDRKTKQDIQNLRTQINVDERELFVNKTSDPESPVTYHMALEYWAVSVRQYIRGIKRLWGDSDHGDKSRVKNVDYYWREKEIGSVTLTPPDRDGYDFSMIAHPEMTETDVRRRLDLPHGEDIPQPVEKTFNGLESILHERGVEYSWYLYTEKSGAPPNWEEMTLHVEGPIPKHILEQAIEVADAFLQQAGIGFKIGDDLPDWGYDEVKFAKDNDDIEVI